LYSIVLLYSLSSLLLTERTPQVSRRGVVFFRKQDNITNDLQKELVQRLGELSGKPKTSGLHIHPVINASRDRGGQDNEISVISSVQNRKLYRRFQKNQTGHNKPQSRRLEWHSDITFEPIPVSESSALDCLPFRVELWLTLDAVE
jgi:alpha-ketoglutarate-dependent taurine dioxygenase